MLELNAKKKIQAAVAILFIAAVTYASASGPEPARTGAPGELVCTIACHDTPSEQPNIGIGSIRVEGTGSNDIFNNVYQPGQTYTLRVVVQHGGRSKYGFQLAAIDLNGNRVGTLESLGPETQVLPQIGIGGRQYIEHTADGVNAAVAGSRTWQIRWTAPSTDVGTVEFYAAGNAANGDGTNQNDFIYTIISRADSPSSKVTATLQSLPDNLTLAVGSIYTISWSVTGASNIDNIELRYSTDDGATFPITNQIFFTNDPSVTSFNWTVPDTPTNQARIRLAIGAKSGLGITPIITGRFTISSDGAQRPPEITKAEVMGKKLFTTGTGFQPGATLYMCEGCTEPATEGNKVKKTTNDEVFTDTVLVSKKAGKQIARGSTVILQVKNADGLLSAPFTFMRPLE